MPIFGGNNFSIIRNGTYLVPQDYNNSGEKGYYINFWSNMKYYLGIFTVQYRKGIYYAILHTEQCGIRFDLNLFDNKSRRFIIQFANAHFLNFNFNSACEIQILKDKLQEFDPN
jgi:hypothetical protein